MHPTNTIPSMRSIPKAANSSIPAHAQPQSIHFHGLCGGLGGLLCLGAPQLLGGGGLDGLVGLADGGGAGNGVLAEVGAVVALGGGVDDGGVDPAMVSRCFIVAIAVSDVSLAELWC
jgi:hypothetical protein